MISLGIIEGIVYNRLTMTRFTGKVIVITGASGGIGEALARAFDDEGGRIVLVSRREENLRVLASGLRDSLVIPGDLSEETACHDIIERTIAHYGRLDILINNAASIIVVPSVSVRTEDLLKAFRTNLCGPVILTQQAIKYMQKQGSGQIINIGSPGFMMGIPFYTPYVCSKAAFSAWTRSIQAEWVESCVKISEYFPGYVSTRSAPESRIGEIPQNFLMEEKQHFIAKLFTRPQSPEEVARQIVRLAIKPRPLRCSSFKVKIGTLISNFPAFRLIISRQMASTARKKIKQIQAL